MNIVNTDNFNYAQCNKIQLHVEWNGGSDLLTTPRIKKIFLPIDITELDRLHINLFIFSPIFAWLIAQLVAIWIYKHPTATIMFRGSIMLNSIIAQEVTVEWGACWFSYLSGLMSS